MKNSPALIAGILIVCIVFSALGTFTRNKVYLSETAIWGDSAEKNNWLDMRSVVAYGLALRREGFNEEAIAVLDKACDIDESISRYDYRNVKLLIGAYANFFEKDEVRDNFYPLILELDPYDEPTLSWMALSYLKDGDIENARIAGSLFARLTDSPFSHYFLGMLYNYCGIFELAEREYNEALKIESDNEFMWLKRIENALISYPDEYTIPLIEQGRPFIAGTAYKAFISILNMNIDYAEQDLYLARIYTTRHQFSLAEIHLNRYLKKAHDRSDPNLIIAIQLLERLQRFDEAYAKLKQHFGDNGEMYPLLAHAAQKAGLWQESYEWYTKTAALTDDPEIRYIMQRKAETAARELP